MNCIDDYDYVGKEQAVFTWFMEKATDFERCVMKELSNMKFLEDFALALAWDKYSEELPNKFCDAWGLTKLDALCYLHYKTAKYNEEIEEEFNEYLLN